MMPGMVPDQMPFLIYTPDNLLPALFLNVRADNEKEALTFLSLSPSRRRGVYSELGPSSKVKATFGGISEDASLFTSAPASSLSQRADTGYAMSTAVSASACIHLLISFFAMSVLHLLRLPGPLTRSDTDYERHPVHIPQLNSGALEHMQHRFQHSAVFGHMLFPIFRRSDSLLFFKCF